MSALSVAYNDTSWLGLTSEYAIRGLVQLANLHMYQYIALWKHTDLFVM